MSIFLYSSDHIDSLYEQLIINTSQLKLSVFQPLYIVTQTEGMNIWLTQQYANTVGIAANIVFQKPNDIIYKIYIALNGPSQITYTGHYMTWKIYEILEDDNFLKRFPIQAQYFQDENIDNIAMKRLRFSEQMADLFDQYQIYRQDMLHEWKNTDLSEHKEWQGYIWRALSDKTKMLNKAENAKNKWSDKNEISDYIKEELSKNDHTDLLKQTIGAVHIFGLSIITSYHLELFNIISKQLDVHFYILNPASNIFWDDTIHSKIAAKFRLKDGVTPEFVTEGNDLLVGWGGLLKSTLRLFFKNDDFINAYEVLPSVREYPNTLLGQIQTEIANNLNDSERADITLDQLKDGSLVIQSNYSTLREVESLYQYLLHLANQNLLNEGRSVLVMVNNVDVYAPYINAVFNHKTHQFKYKIADEKLTEVFDLFGLLSYVLELRYNTFSANQFIELLSFNTVKTMYAITDIEFVKNALHKANIIYGIENDIANDTYLVSWKYGLMRMMLGVCIADEPFMEYLQMPIVPTDIAEGHNTIEILKIVALVEDLTKFLQKTKGKYTLSEWLNIFEHDMLQPFTDLLAEDHEQLHALQKIIEQYKDTLAVFDIKVFYDVFTADLAKMLAHEQRNTSFLSGGITFCSLIPMRSIPFDYVAVLGLNQHEFPRRENNVSFDLIQQSPQAGDRNVKDNDKHLILETLFSTQKSLYLSYIGTNINNNSIQPPSVIIDELLFYIQKKCAVEVYEHLVVKQPLHKFSNAYNRPEQPDLYYYDDNTSGVSFVNKLIGEESTEVVFDQVDVNDLVFKLTYPTRNYVNSQMKLKLKQYQITLLDEEREDFEDFQEQNLVKEYLKLTEQEASALFQKTYYQGNVWTLKNIAAVQFESVWEKSNALKMNLLQKGYDITKAEDIAIDIDIAGINVVGKVTNVVNNELFLFYTGKELSYRAYIEAYIYGSLLHYAGKALKINIVLNDDVEFVLDFTDYSQDLVVAYFDVAIEQFKLSFIRPILYHYRMKNDQIDDVNAFYKMQYASEKSHKDEYILLFEKEWSHTTYTQYVQEYITKVEQPIADFCFDVEKY